MTTQGFAQSGTKIIALLGTASKLLIDAGMVVVGSATGKKTSNGGSTMMLSDAQRQELLTKMVDQLYALVDSNGGKSMIGAAGKSFALVLSLLRTLVSQAFKMLNSASWARNMPRDVTDKLERVSQTLDNNSSSSNISSHIGADSQQDDVVMESSGGETTYNPHPAYLIRVSNMLQENFSPSQSSITELVQKVAQLRRDAYASVKDQLLYMLRENRDYDLQNLPAEDAKLRTFVDRAIERVESIDLDALFDASNATIVWAPKSKQQRDREYTEALAIRVADAQSTGAKAKTKIHIKSTYPFIVFKGTHEMLVAFRLGREAMDHLFGLTAVPIGFGTTTTSSPSTAATATAIGTQVAPSLLDDDDDDDEDDEENARSLLETANTMEGLIDPEKITMNNPVLESLLNLYIKAYKLKRDAVVKLFKKALANQTTEGTVQLEDEITDIVNAVKRINIPYMLQNRFSSAQQYINGDDNDNDAARSLFEADPNNGNRLTLMLSSRKRLYQLLDTYKRLAKVYLQQSQDSTTGAPDTAVRVATNLSQIGMLSREGLDTDGNGTVSAGEAWQGLVDWTSDKIDAVKQFIKDGASKAKLQAIVAKQYLKDKLDNIVGQHLKKGLENSAKAYSEFVHRLKRMRPDKITPELLKAEFELRRQFLTEMMETRLMELFPNPKTDVQKLLLSDKQRQRPHVPLQLPTFEDVTANEPSAPSVDTAATSIYPSAAEHNGTDAFDDDDDDMLPRIRDAQTVGAQCTITHEYDRNNGNLIRTTVEVDDDKDVKVMLDAGMAPEKVLSRNERIED